MLVLGRRTLRKKEKMGEIPSHRIISGDFARKPCSFSPHTGHLSIPELGALVAIIANKDQPVARFGYGRAPKKPPVAEGAAPHAAKFFTPHALTVDSKGNLSVPEWTRWDRVWRFTPHPPDAGAPPSVQSRLRRRDDYPTRVSRRLGRRGDRH